MASLSAPRPVDAVVRRPHGLLEGPRLTAAGVAFYSDVTAGGVFSISPDGSVTELVPKRGGVGGLVLHEDGGVVIGGRTLLHASRGNGSRELLATTDVTGFNDLSTTPDGSLLVGALRYRPFAGEAPLPGLLLRVIAPGAAQVLSEWLLWPNGIGLSPDGSRLYVSDYARGQVMTMMLEGGPEEVFCEVPTGSADGLAVDREGGVWVALGEGGAIARFDAQGTLDGAFDVPCEFVSSLCFGGADGMDVLISTADNRVSPDNGGALFRARSDVPGVPVPLSRI